MQTCAGLMMFHPSNHRSIQRCYLLKLLEDNDLGQDGHCFDPSSTSLLQFSLDIWGNIGVVVIFVTICEISEGTSNLISTNMFGWGVVFFHFPYYQPPAIPPAFPGPEMCGFTATSTTSVPTPAALPAPAADMHWQPHNFTAPGPEEETPLPAAWPEAPQKAAAAITATTATAATIRPIDILSSSLDDTSKSTLQTSHPSPSWTSLATPASLRPSVNNLRFFRFPVTCWRMRHKHRPGQCCQQQVICAVCICGR